MVKYLLNCSVNIIELFKILWDSSPKLEMLSEMGVRACKLLDIKLLILRGFIIFTKHFFTFHSNRVKCEKQILTSAGFEPTTSYICGNRLTARPRGPHG